jgi:basic membrane lipoprotein Med (substrate-binding protein (PBP1-ABC) superfamily)
MKWIPDGGWAPVRLAACLAMLGSIVLGACQAAQPAAPSATAAARSALPAGAPTANSLGTAGAALSPLPTETAQPDSALAVPKGNVKVAFLDSEQQDPTPQFVEKNLSYLASQWKTDAGWEMTYQLDVPFDQQQAALRSAADRGANLIIVYGPHFGEAVKSVAPDYPKVLFVQNGSPIQAANVVNFGYKYGELGYFAGMAAGLVTHNLKIGIIAPQDGPVKADVEAAQKEAQAANPAVEVSVAWTSAPGDVTGAKPKIQAELDRGDDVLIVMDQTLGPEAYAMAQAKGVQTILGWEAVAEIGMYPPGVIAQGIQAPTRLMTGLVQHLQAGHLTGNMTYRGGLSECAQIFTSWGASVPKSVSDQVGQAIIDYRNGKLDIGVARDPWPFTPCTEFDPKG